MSLRWHQVLFLFVDITWVYLQTGNPPSQAAPLEAHVKHCRGGNCVSSIAHITNTNNAKSWINTQRARMAMSRSSRKRKIQVVGF